MNNNYNLYDKIVSATYTNILNSIMIKGEDGVFSVGKDVIFSELPSRHDYAHKVFQQVSFMVAEMTGCKVAIKMNIFQFIYYRYIKKNKLLRWKKRNEWPNIFIGELAHFEAEAFEQSIDIFEEIWKAYYERKK